jgi:Putative adhesin
MGRPILALGGIALIGIGVAVAFGFYAQSTAEADSRVADVVHTVKIDQASGEVRIRVGDVPSASVHETFHYSFSRPGDAFRVDGGQLVLGDCGSHCRVDFDVVVPSGTAVIGGTSSGDIDLEGVASADVSANSGAVRVNNVTGAVKVQANSGDISLNSIDRDVVAQADSGDISGTLLRGKVNLQADSGSVRLRLDASDAANSVRVKADSGDVDLIVPNVTYRIEGNSDSGRRDISVPQDPASSRLLQLDTDSGDVTVRAA